ncbi:F-box protein At4g18380-like [Silene latifolia]|uniref:F-box protein At4g18380-like n=1 Tax=Silene latifolia TaxID=37657 RepID=UPI003D77F5F0
MSSTGSDPAFNQIHPDPPPETTIDHFETIPDALLLLIFNKIGDVKALGRCGVVSKRFHSLVPQVENVVVRVDCVISDDDSSTSSSSSSTSSSTSDKSRSALSNLVRIIFGNIFKPLQAFASHVINKRPMVNGVDSDVAADRCDQGGVTHHSPTQVLKNFTEIKFLRIELPTGELGIDDGVLLTWRADFGSTLDNCVILGASSIVTAKSGQGTEVNGEVNGNNAVTEDNGSIPESFYTNGGLKLRVVWTISSLIAASARHYLLQPIIGEHQTLDSLVLTDADGQGVLCMNRDQLEELRVKPLSASSASKRTLVPALNMRLWYAPHLELSDGVVLKGATLVAIRPSDQAVVGNGKKEISDLSWVSNAFEGPYGTAAKMLVKRRTYCLEMNSF